MVGVSTGDYILNLLFPFLSEKEFSHLWTTNKILRENLSCYFGLLVWWAKHCPDLPPPPTMDFLVPSARDISGFSSPRESRLIASKSPCWGHALPGTSSVWNCDIRPGNSVQLGTTLGWDCWVCVTVDLSLCQIHFLLFFCRCWSLIIYIDILWTKSLLCGLVALFSIVHVFEQDHVICPMLVFSVHWRWMAYIPLVPFLTVSWKDSPVMFHDSMHFTKFIECWMWAAWSLCLILNRTWLTEGTW